jgi:hypothetical protein
VLCPGASGPDTEVLAALNAAVALFGILEVAAPMAIWQREPALATLHRAAPRRLLIRRDLEEAPPGPFMLPLPRATLLLPWVQRPLPDTLISLHRPLHLVFAPEDLADGHPLRRWRDTHTNHIALAEFLLQATR